MDYRDIPVPSFRRTGVDAMGTQIRDLEEDLMPKSSLDAPALPLDYLGVPEALRLNVDVAPPPCLELPAPSFDVEVDPEDSELAQSSSGVPALGGSAVGGSSRGRRQVVEVEPEPQVDRDGRYLSSYNPLARIGGAVFTLLLVALWAGCALYVADLGPSTGPASRFDPRAPVTSPAMSRLPAQSTSTPEASPSASSSDIGR